MANGKISGMTAAGALAAADLLEISQTAGGPTTKSITGANIQTLAWTSPNVTGTLTVATNTTITNAGSSTILAGGTTVNNTLQGEGAVGVTITRFSTDTSSPTFTAVKARGTIASPSVVAQNDILGAFNFRGRGSTANQFGAIIEAVVSEPTPSDTAMGTKLLFQVAPLGTASVITAATLASNDLSVPGTVTTVSLTFAGLPSSPVAGARAFITDGNVAVAFNTAVTAGGGSSKGPVFYDGTNWRWG